MHKGVFPLLVCLGLVACGGAPAPVVQTVEVTRAVPVEVTKVVEVTRIVEVTRVVAATAAPPAAAPSTATPKPAVGEAKLELRNWMSYTSFSTLYVIGEAINTGNGDARSMELAVSLVDGDGKTVASSSVNLAGRRRVKAGEAYPFKVLFDKPPAAWKTVKFQFAATTAKAGDFDLFPPAQGLTLVTSPPTAGSFGTRYAGTVKNGGSKTAELVSIVVVAYDKGKNVIGVGEGFAKLNAIPAGGDSPFDVTVDTKGTPDGFAAFVEGSEKN